MKKIILALATLLFMGSAATKAQVTKVTVRSISGNSKEEVENIDNAKYRITYEEMGEQSFHQTLHLHG